MPAGTIKGSVVKEIIAYIRKHEGEAGLQRLLDRFAPEELKWLGPKLIAVAKVPAPILCKLYDGITELWGHGEGAYYSTLMETVAERNLNTFMKFFIRIGKPSFIVQGAPLVWKQFFDVGNLIYLQGDDHLAELKAVGGKDYGPALCAGIIGWGTMAIRMSGGRNIRVDHSECIYKGADQCVFRVQWD